MGKENPRASDSLGHYKKHQTKDSRQQKDNTALVFIIWGGDRSNEP